MTEKFNIKAPYKPAGDQPKAISSLVKGLRDGVRMQTLLGVTGSGKTFTMANVIAQIEKPTLVIAHNKTLAAQLAQEYREFFPHNSVHYFVSYYDYYQPEAYMPATDTYIEKEAQINAEIERLRHASTQALLTRRDVIVVASVSCIYGLGSPEEYEKVHRRIVVGMPMRRHEFIRTLISLYFERTNADLSPGHFRSIGSVIEIMPVNEETTYRIEIDDDQVTAIIMLHPVTHVVIGSPNSFFLFPAKHSVTPEDEKERALKAIQRELQERLRVLKKAGNVLEYERLKRRTGYDVAMIREVGYCNGIENYSRHFDGRKEGAPPHTLLSYFPHTPDGKPDFLTVIDESHVTIPQLNGMYAGDRSRKQMLIEHGFRLPSALDNRPLRFEEFDTHVGQIVCTSATPAAYERKESGQIIEQAIRPTGLLDPKVIVRGIEVCDSYVGEVKDFIAEAKQVVAGGGRVLATTLTKKMAEDVSAYLNEQGIKATFVHSDIKTIERIEIITQFRRGEFDCLVGVNLLREGLDMPEVEFIGILDADKEGFLRSETSLIQIIGRAARNVRGRVVLYADTVTTSMQKAIDETHRRREKQLAYNVAHGITPTTIKKEIKDITEHLKSEHRAALETMVALDEELFSRNPQALLKRKTEQMNSAVKILDFETAALIRDEVAMLEARLKAAKNKRAPHG